MLDRDAATYHIHSGFSLGLDLQTGMLPSAENFLARPTTQVGDLLTGTKIRRVSIDSAFGGADILRHFLTP